MFVITLVPSSDARGNIGKSLENFRYLGGGDFTGKPSAIRTAVCRAVCWS